MVMWAAKDKGSQRGPCLAQGHTVNLRTHGGQPCKGGSFQPILTHTLLAGLRGMQGSGAPFCKERTE